MNILEELFLGNLDPVREYVQGQEDYWELLRETGAEKKRRLSGLSPEDRKIVEEVMDAENALHLMSEQKAFAYGFRLAVRFLCDSM